ncbi:hypothetical protein DY000_02025226 [Brassica cretica]|uniref:Uncharacterized protein n=1 Tax=Brassica cretica TaxID=69181 RepID=A0ABQ7EAE5_BRACR|nr:hypothetical protein DY000_02025226 [Brassica cretica]
MKRSLRRLFFQVKRPAEFLNCPFTEEEEESGSVKEIANLCSLSSLEINKNGTIRVGVDTNVFFRKSELVFGRMIALYKWRKRLKRSLDVRLRGLGLIFQ